MKRWQKVGFFSCAVLLFLISNINTVAAQQSIKFVWGDYYPPQHTNAKTAEWWGSQIEKKTNGRITFEYYWNSSLVSAREQMSGIKGNVIQVTSLPAAYYPDLAPITSMTAAPMLHLQSFDNAMKATDEFNRTNPEVNKEFASLNVKFLFTLGAAHHYLFSKKEIKTLSELQGRKVRTFGHFTTLFKAVGANLVSVTLPEIYNALDRGLVDSTTSYLSPAIGNRVHEVTQYLVKSDLGHNCNGPVVVNMDAWKKLPEDIKKIFEDTSAEASAKYLELTKTDYETNMNIIRSREFKVCEFPESDIAKLKEIAKRDIWESYAEKIDKRGIKFSEAWNSYLNVIDKYNSVK